MRWSIRCRFGGVSVLFHAGRWWRQMMDYGLDVWEIVVLLCRRRGYVSGPVAAAFDGFDGGGRVFHRFSEFRKEKVVRGATGRRGKG